MHVFRNSCIILIPLKTRRICTPSAHKPQNQDLVQVQLFQQRANVFYQKPCSTDASVLLYGCLSTHSFYSVSICMLEKSCQHSHIKYIISTEYNIIIIDIYYLSQVRQYDSPSCYCILNSFICIEKKETNLKMVLLSMLSISYSVKEQSPQRIKILYGCFGGGAGINFSYGQ